MLILAPQPESKGNDALALASPIRTTIILPAALAGFYLLWSGAVSAEPMKCGGEQKTCIASCKMVPNRLSACLTLCSARQAYCVRTGCWDDGLRRYCGLAKQ